MTRECIPHKILVVDDLETIREWAKHVLQLEGYEVATTDNPVLVPVMVFKERPQLVLLDVAMPLLGGGDVAKILDPDHSFLLVFYSSKPPEELEALTLQCGADGFIEKTSDGVALVRQVAKLIGKPKR